MVITICVSILSFTYGVVTVQYKIFPYEKLREIKQLVSSGQNHSGYYYNKTSFYDQNGRHDYDLVFIGDSITDIAEWEDLFPSLKIANRGINGDTTGGVLDRLDSIYSTNANRAFIMIGVNDFVSGMSVNEVFENYKAIVNRLVAHEMNVYIQSTILTGMRYKELNTKIADLNERLMLLSTKQHSITYIDLNAGLSKNSILNPMYSMDDTHLNGKGYAVWKDIISPYVK